MQAYMFRLYLEFARVASPDRDTGKMDYVYEEAAIPASLPLPMENAAEALAEAEAVPIGA
jgi:hypothetical protein